MNKFLLTIMLLFFILLNSCEKDEAPELKTLSKEDLKQCRGCSGSWDLIDTIP